MTESLKRFTPEQYELVRREILEQAARMPFDLADMEAVLAVLGPERQEAGIAGVKQILSNGHMICCPEAFLAIFLSGFLHGWRSREMLLQCDDLERTVGDAHESPDRSG